MRRWLALFLLALVVLGCSETGAGPDSSARIFQGAPATLDPAAAGDASSAAVIAQLFETLTAFDAERELRPALAESWSTDDEGRRITFHLRPDLTFSDGTPLRASDVVRSWLRVIDPERPSPLSSLMLDVEGAAAYLTGATDASGVGLRADDASGDVTVDLVRPAAEFATIVASPTFAVVPEGIDARPRALEPSDGFVGSGAYRLVDDTGPTLELAANPRYWAGEPAIQSISLVTDIGGRSSVAAFEDGELDYAPISEADASWIAYDEQLGPQLREVPSLSVTYYGFDTSRAPFDDVRVRQAFAAAVDWRRIARLSVSDPAAVATSMVPPGIPGRSDRDVVPAHDPEAARALLAAAGFPGGVGFPKVTLMTGGAPYDAAVAMELERELGIEVDQEIMDFGTYFDRLDHDPPQMWNLSWVADYPGRNDFLGVLLGSGSSNNYGRWVSPEFDDAIAEARSTTDEAVAGPAFDRAEDIARRDAPVIPVTYGTGWALASDGLLGATQNGLGSLRFGGLAWAP
jgi:ABC-type transport system substrate-binding protein